MRYGGGGTKESVPFHPLLYAFRIPKLTGWQAADWSSLLSMRI